MPSSKGYTVLVADQHSVARAGVKAVLARERCKVIEADNGRDALRIAMKLKPNVAIIDVVLPRMSGFVLAHQIIQNNLGTKVMFLTAATADREIERAWAIKVHGYLCKTTPIEQLPDAVRALMSGDKWFDSTAKLCISMHSSIPDWGEKDNLLSQRELEVLWLINERNTNKQIGVELGISEKTVMAHRDSLYKKLKVNDTVGLIQKAKDAGWI